MIPAITHPSPNPSNAKLDTKKINTKESPEPNKAPEAAVTVELGNSPAKTITYEKKDFRPNIHEMDRLKQSVDDALKPLRSMVEELLKRQGMTFRDTSLNVTKEKMVEIDAQTRAEANRLISDGGEFSAENTAQRLFDFALTVSGGDKSKLDDLKAAIQKGYEAASEAFGGELPEISKQTIDLTMKKLDAWASHKEEV